MSKITAILKPPPKLIAVVKRVDKVEPILPDLLTLYRLAKI